MNKEQYQHFQAHFFTHILGVTEKKMNDYSGMSESPFDNFTSCEKLGLCTVEQGYLVRMMDKMMRLASITRKEASVKDETIEDTLMDICGYAVSLAGYLESKKRSSEGTRQSTLEFPGVCDAARTCGSPPSPSPSS